MDEAEFCNIIGMMYRSRLIALDDPDALKEKMRGMLFEIDCREPGRAEEILKDLPYTHDVAVHGVLLHVLVSAEKEKRGLEKALQSNGIAVKRIERVQPSLEDVFVSLVEDEDRPQMRDEIE